MKLHYILLFILSVAFFNAYSQNQACAGMHPICTNAGLSFTAQTGVPAASTTDPGNNYGCLSSSPNPTWYYLEVATAGDIIMSLSAASDIDFALWGPFPNLANAQANCGTYGAVVPNTNCVTTTFLGIPTGTTCDGKGCSFSTSATETPGIPNAQVGQVYVLLITNYASSVQAVSLTQTGGTGSTNCTIVTNPTCSMSGLTANIIACNNNLPTLSYDISGTVTFVNPPTTGQLIVQDCFGTQQTFNAPFGSSQNYTFTGLPHDGQLCNITAYFTADNTCTITSSIQAPSPITFFSVNCTTGTGDLDGSITFSAPPTTGQLVISVNDGTTTVNATFNPPFTSPQVWNVTGLNPAANPYVIDYYFTNNPTCNQTTTINCGCAADAGTTTSTQTGNGATNFILCDGDRVDITTNLDYSYPDNSGLLGGYTYQPELVYLVYKCMPTPGVFPGSDPCFVTIVPSPQDLTDINSGASLNDFFGTGAVNQTLYLTPITLYHYDPVLGNYILNANCWDIGPITTVTYLNPIVEIVTPDCQTGSVTVNLTGGYPELFGGNFTASNLSPANAVFAATTTLHGGNIVINGLINGDMWSFDVVDANNCPKTISGGPFVGLPIANAGIDGTSCTLNYTLAATPSIGTGTWTGPAGITFGTPNSATSTASATTAGGYTLTWTEDNGGGCISTDNVSVTLSNLAYTTSIVNSLCGTANGSITFTAIGGVPPYTYSINNGTTTQAVAVFSGLTAATYSCVVTDAIGCQVSTTEIVSNSGGPTISSITTSNPLCNTSCDGSFTVNATGGTAPYTYSFNGGAFQSSNVKSSLCVGAYTVSVKDANSCIVAGTTTLTEPSAITITSSSTDPLCFGGGGGSINVFASGGTVTSNYSYTINNGAGVNLTQTNGAFTGISGGNYSISVTDNNSCLSTSNITVIEPVAIGSVVNSTTNTSCFGACDGAADVSGTGGSVATGYHYLWDDFSAQTSSLAVGLCGGTPSQIYTVTITDDNGCFTTRQVQISEPTALAISSSTISSTCAQSNGTACVTVTGGAGGYSYLWNSSIATQCVSGVVAGGYSVVVTDANSCTITANAVITDLSGPTATTTVTNVQCFGGTDGTGTVIVAGGSGTFSYNWTNTGAITVGNAVTAVNLSGGTYFVNVTDDVTGCTVSSSVSVSEPNALQYGSSTVNPTCFGYNDGSISVNVMGGTSPYTYIWNTIPSQSSATAINLTVGGYNVDISDAHSCSASISNTLTEPTPVSATENSQDVSCFNGGDASITITPSGGESSYTYNWGNNPFTSNVVMGLSVGAQTYTVTDIAGCTFSNTVIINEPTELTISVNTSGNVTCNGGTNGYITSSTFGGTPPYTYQWSFGLSTTANLTGIPANTYCVTVTDNKGCQNFVCQQISQPTEVVGSIPTVNDVNCYAACDGSVIASATGGNSPYFYQWNLEGNLSNQATANNLCPSTNIVVSITDNSGCGVTVSTQITEPPAITVTPKPLQPHCGQSDGLLDLIVDGGVPSFTYQWSDSAFGTSISAIDIPAGVYAVTITDANSCKEVQVFNLNDISGPTITYLNHTNPSCNGASDGIINMNVNGGTLPYQFIGWVNSNIDTVSVGAVGITLIPADIYTAIVVDSAGCFSSLTQVLTEPSSVIAGITTQTNVSCFGGSDGTATVQAGGGSFTGYTYSWIPTGQTTVTATGLSAGPVAVVVTDPNGCSANTTTTITEPPALALSSTVTDVTCFGESNGCVNLSVSGGTAGFYLYNWSCSSNTNANICGLPATTCITTVSDQNSCNATITSTINQPTQLTATTNVTDAFCTAANGVAEIVNVAGGTPPYVSSLPGGSTTFTSTGLAMGVYTLDVADNHGCALSLPVTVNDQPGPIINSLSFVSPTCFSNCDGSATVSVTGGNSPLSYIWCDVASQATATAFSLCSGSYCVTVTDNKGCVAVDYGILTEPSELLLAALPPAVQVCDGECASIGAMPSGGTPGATGYQVTWSDSTLSGFGPMNLCLPPSTNNTYTATVTDAMGCQAISQTLVTVGAELIVNMPDTVETCLGNPVLISSTGFGGTNIADYQWTWSNGDTCNAVITCDITVKPTDTTLYMVTLEDGCSTPVSNFITVLVFPLPTPSYGVLSSEGCPPFEAYFNGSSSMNNSTMEWDFNADGIIDYTEQNLMVGQSSTPIYTYNEAGLYSVEITVISEKQCSTSVSIVDYITIYPRPIATFFTDPENSNTLINPIVSVNAISSIGVDSLYSWDFNDEFNTQTEYGETATHFYQDTGSYYIALDVVNTAGCHDYDTVKFVINPDFAIYAPNAFTPNDNAINDGFKLRGVGIQDLELYIYDRWGELISTVNGLDKSWDGTVKKTGKLVPNDVYIWKAYVTPINNTQPLEYMGHVTVVR